jgi:hypothetical protein
MRQKGRILKSRLAWARSTGPIDYVDQYDPQAEMAAIHKQVGGWFEGFVGTPPYQALSVVQKDKAPGIVRFFAEHSFRYVGAAPEEWNPAVLRECCLEIMPRKMSAEQAFFQAVAPVLSAFFRFLGERSLLRNARELASTVAELDGEIVCAPLLPDGTAIASPSGGQPAF